MSDKLRGGTTIGGYTAWHRGNMGPGSGLDADTVDGGYNAWHTGNDGAGSGLDADLIDGIDSDKLCKYETRTANTSASDRSKLGISLPYTLNSLKSSAVVGAQVRLIVSFNTITPKIAGVGGAILSTE